MPFNMNPSMNKYRKLLYRDNSAQDWLLSWGFDSTHKCFNAVLSSSFFFLTEWCTTFSSPSSVDAVLGQTVAACR